MKARKSWSGLSVEQNWENGEWRDQRVDFLFITLFSGKQVIEM